MSPEIKIIGFGSHGHVQESRNHTNDGFSLSPTDNSESYESKTKQNNSTELFAISFHKFPIQMSQKMPNNRLNMFALFVPLIF